MLIKSNLLFSAFIFLFINFGFSQESGLASFYGDAFQGSQTASGELYDRTKMTCAHRSHPFGTYLKVTRKDNGRSVVVKVNDRGPHIKGRIVDVSKEAAKKLGLISDGVAEVTIEKTSKSSNAKVAEVNKTATKGIAIPAEKEVIRKVTESEKAADNAKKRADELAAKAAVEKKEKAAVAKEKAKQKAAEKERLAAAKVKEEKPVEFKEPKLVGLKNYSEFGLYKIQVMKPEKKGFGVQVASINNHENMLKQIAHFQGKYFKNILTSIEKSDDGGTVYKIILGPFPDQKTAQSYKRSLAKKHKINGFVISLEK